MSMGAICFTSSGSNGGCWVVLVFPRLFFGKMGFFSPYATFAKKKSLRDLHQKKKFRRKKTRLTPKKKIKKRLTLISTIELRFPRCAQARGKFACAGGGGVVGAPRRRGGGGLAMGLL